MRSYPSWIAGIRHSGQGGFDRGRYCARLARGEALELRREPDNEHDDNATAIHHRGHHIGYVPRRHDWVGRALDQGRALECEVVEVERTSGFLHSRADHIETLISVRSTTGPSIEEREAAEERRYQKQRLAMARGYCVDGLRALAYLTLVDGKRSPEEHNIEISVIESRLIMAGFDREPDVLAALAEQAAALSVSQNAMTRSVNVLAKDESYFRLVYEAAKTIADVDGKADAGEALVIDRLERAGKANGWL